MAPGRSTVPDDSGLRISRRGRGLRRLFTLVIVALLVFALVGLLGVRTTTISAAGGGYRLQLHYAKVVRPGLAVPWELRVTSAGGFDGPVTLATKSSYLDIYDENSLDPEPVHATQDGDRVIWQFEPPAGDTLIVSFDWRVEPGVQLKWPRGETSVLDEDGRPVATIRYRTWVTP